MIKIPLIGWISISNIKCAKCGKDISKFVSCLDVYNNMPFHYDCEIDYRSDEFVRAILSARKSRGIKLNVVEEEFLASTEAKIRDVRT